MIDTNIVEEDDDELLSSTEVAAKFRVDPKTVSRWQKKGRFEQYGIQVFFTPGGHRRWRKADIERLMFQLFDEGEEEALRNKLQWEAEHARTEVVETPPKTSSAA